MEDYANTKIETFDELMTKHTRRELEELALKYGIENLGGTKSQLAEYILETIKKQKEPPKSTPQVSSIPQVSPKEAPMIEKSNSTTKVAMVGKKGVMAKVTAINSKTAEMKQGIAVFQKSVAVQSKENREAAAKFNSGVKTLQKENHEAAAKIYSGARAIQSQIDAQITEMKNYTSDFYYG